MHGSICQPSSVSDVQRLRDISANLTGLVNNGSAQFVVTCSSPIDHNVGTSQQWSTMVNDGTSTGAVECFGGALDIAGTFRLARKPLPEATHVEIDSAELALMLEGIELDGAKRRKRYRHDPT